MTSWDPDGSGPATPIVVVDGSFAYAGDRAVDNVVGWLPGTAQYGSVGTLDSRVCVLRTLPNGDLVAGGYFTGGVARFDTSSNAWVTIGNGVSGFVNALAVLPNGDVVAGGNFSILGGTAGNVARWDGTTWSSLGTGTDTEIRALTVRPNGHLIAGGTFAVAGGTACSRVAQWDGSSWSPLGIGLSGLSALGYAVNALTTLPNGDVVAGGTFTFADGNPAGGLARWDGTAWSPWTGGAGANRSVDALRVTPSGDLLVAGSFFQLDGQPISRIARWNGTAWATYGTGTDGQVLATTFLPNGDLFVGGNLSDAGGVPVRGVASFRAGAWSAMGSGTDSGIAVLHPLRNGDLVAGGGFRQIDGVAANRVARRVANTWTALGSGVTNPGAAVSVQAVAELPNGDLVIGGQFSFAGGVAATNVARWNGNTWAPLGAGLPIGVAALLAMPNGDLIAGGSFHTAYGAPADFLARWNGTTWAPLGGSVTGPWYAVVSELALLPNGDVVIGGVFTGVGGVVTENLARWNGTQWHALGQPFSPSSRVGALRVAQDGALLAAGTFTTIGGVAANYIARFDGTNWAQFGALQSSPNTSVWSLAEGPDGDVLAGGNLLRANGQNWSMVRWDGTAWQTAWSPTGSVGALAVLPNGDLAVGGTFTTPASAVNFALLRSPCPATSTSFGSGCTGTGGANQLTATALPWLGATFRARATGLAPNSLAIGVRGLGIVSTPLFPLLPQALPGCTLRVSADLLDLYAANPFVPGVADVAFAIPATAALIGGVLHQQVVPVVFDANGAIVEFSATNALTLTIGAW